MAVAGEDVELKGDFCVYHEACYGILVCAHEPLREGRVARRNQTSSSHEEVTREGMLRHSASWSATPDGSARWLSLEGCLLLSERAHRVCPVLSGHCACWLLPSRAILTVRPHRLGCPGLRHILLGHPLPSSKHCSAIPSTSSRSYWLPEASSVTPMCGSCEQWPSQATNA